MRLWHVAATLPGRERFAEEHLNRQGFETYVPLLKIEYMVRGARRWREVALFASYVMIRFDRVTERWRSINGTLGVNHLLPMGVEEPFSLPSGYIEKLKSREEAGEFSLDEAMKVTLGYAVGDMVSITSGKYANFGVGSFLRTRRGRVMLLLSLLGREIVIEVAPHQVQSSGGTIL